MTSIKFLLKLRNGAQMIADAYMQKHRSQQ